MTDHLEDVCRDGVDSAGRYTPHSMRLRLRGTAAATDHVVYLHEVHHAALNDVTAWGSVLHIYARLPAPFLTQFRSLLDACRTTHESLATFASMQIATARHGVIDALLETYPGYLPLCQATQRLTAGVGGPNRRQLVVTAMARLCMQTPILEHILASGPDDFRLAVVPDVDRPDSRWRWFSRRGPAALTAAADEADRIVLDQFGPTALVADGPASDLYQASDRSHDAAWAVWENQAYERLRAMLASSGARTMGFNDHQDATAALLAQVEQTYGYLGLRAAMSYEESLDDAAVASSILQQVRHDLSDGDRYRASLLAPNELPTIVESMTHRPVHDGMPALVIDARPADRMIALFRWPSDTQTRLSARTNPVVAVRAFIDDGESGELVGHAVIADPNVLADVAARWSDAGPVVSCVSASCAADQDWSRLWLAPLRRLGPVFILVDIEPDRFVYAWVRDGHDVVAIGLEVNDTAGQQAALLFTADNGGLWWMVVSNDVTVRLTGELLRARLGPRLRSEPGLLKPIRREAIVAITHVLATESFVSFDALGGHRGD